jgi:hypothetical protein
MFGVLTVIGAQSADPPLSDTRLTIEKLPVHFSGEVLAGLAQSAQRMGRAGESTQYLDSMLALLQGTPYEPSAKEWKADPPAAARTSLTCKTCHNPGRLSARRAALDK